MANQGLSNKYYSNDGSPSIEAFKGPYASLAEALVAIPQAFRQVGREVLIKTGNRVKTYKLDGFNDNLQVDRESITVANIIPIENTMTITGGTGGGLPIYVDPAGLPVNSNTNTFLNSNYSLDAIGTEVYDTINRFMYKKISSGVWVKTAAINPDLDMDPIGVIQGINLISYK